MTKLKLPKCPKTATEEHNWKTHTVSFDGAGHLQGVYPLEFPVCRFCGLVDDRGGRMKKMSDKEKTRLIIKYGQGLGPIGISLLLKYARKI